MSLLLLLALGVACGLWARFSRDPDAVLPIIGIVVFGVAASVGSLAAIINHASFAPDMAEIAVTREAVSRLPCGATFSGSQVYSQAVGWNQRIVANRVWNRRWITDPFVPDGWDTVTVIQLPDCR